jgi:hypothetical protein
MSFASSNSLAIRNDFYGFRTTREGQLEVDRQLTVGTLADVSANTFGLRAENATRSYVGARIVGEEVVLRGRDRPALNTARPSYDPTAQFPMKDWIRAAPLPVTTDGMFSVAWSPEAGVFVAVSGDSRAYFYISRDGVNWFTQTIAAAATTWGAVAWSPELRLFAVTNQSTNTQVATSPDGINWSPRTSTANITVRSLIWSKERSLFVGVGNSQTFVTSTNGLVWRTHVLPVSLSCEDVVWAPELGIFLAVAQTSTTIVASENGILWATRSLLATQNSTWRSVTWSPELRLLVAVASAGANGRLMTSSDGISWTSRTVVAEQWFYVRWVREIGLFVALAGATTNRLYMTSSDGINWTTRMHGRTGIDWRAFAFSPQLRRFVGVGTTTPADIMYCDVDPSAPMIDTTNEIPWTLRSSPANNQWRSVAWLPERRRVVAVSATGTNTRVMISDTSGDSWEVRTPAANNAWNSVVWVPEASRLVAVSGGPGSGTRVMVSDDFGDTWQTRSSPVDNTWQAVVWLQEVRRLVAVSSLGSLDNVMISTDNGDTWTTRSTLPNGTWKSVSWLADRNTLVAMGENIAANSTNFGDSWTTRAILGRDWTAQAYIPRIGRLVAVSSITEQPYTPIDASGGQVTLTTMTNSVIHRVHTYSTVGTTSFDVASLGTSDGAVEYLVVAGGGGAGGRDICGGGGAGGYRCSVAGEQSGGGASAESPFTVSVGSYTVVVGKGGTGQLDGQTPPGDMKGDNSSFDTIVSIGGGAGKVFNFPVPDNGAGGSGGGASGLIQGTAPLDNQVGGEGTIDQGYDGGTPALDDSNTNYGGTGGGGAAGDGLNADDGKNGGPGLMSAIDGVPTFRGGGGGGAGHRTSGSQQNGQGGVGGGGSCNTSTTTSTRDGVANTGGGGGASRGLNLRGGSGGSGVVIVRYPFRRFFPTAVAYSDDAGNTWTTVLSAEVETSWRSVVWVRELNRLFAVGGAGSSTRAMYSDDYGVSWTTMTTPANNDWRALTWLTDVNRLVAVGSPATGGLAGFYAMTQGYVWKPSAPSFSLTVNGAAIVSATDSLVRVTGATVQPFTGAHAVEVSLRDSERPSLAGRIMISLGHVRQTDLSNVVPRVALSSEPFDRRVYGVLNNHHGQMLVNAVGEGGIWVCDEGGAIENGDYITTGTLSGYGRRQPDSRLHSYTVAKATMDCDFGGAPSYKKKRYLRKGGPGAGTEDNTAEISHQEYLEAFAAGQPVYRAAFIACTYHCG